MISNTWFFIALVCVHRTSWFSQVNLATVSHGFWPPQWSEMENSGKVRCENLICTISNDFELPPIAMLNIVAAKLRRTVISSMPSPLCIQDQFLPPTQRIPNGRRKVKYKRNNMFQRYLMVLFNLVHFHWAWAVVAVGSTNRLCVACDGARTDAAVTKPRETWFCFKIGSKGILLTGSIYQSKKFL